MCVQFDSIISAYIYVESDAPLYHRGNFNLFIINILGIMLFLLAKAYYVFRNKQREKIWNAMSEEDRKEYAANMTIQGSKRLDFRFAH
jgi:lysylphosphatidylglycerol synthetase-like protein (DUF2156 family)